MDKSMIDFKWEILEVFCKADLLYEVKFSLEANDKENTVKTEGYHQYSDGVVYKNFSEIKEEDLIRWLEKDTVKDDVNIIKLNLEKQLGLLKNSKKAEFPWLANTFTVE
jgi:hypothetical protein